MQYLKDNVIVEPLVNGWYAWPYLVSPITNALIFKHVHLPMLKSFCKAPNVHVRASRTPTLRGGPYLGLPADATELVEKFCRSSEQRFASTIELAEAITTVWNVLEEKADGASLEHIYSELPDLVKGRIELMYDGASNAHPRFIEPLFYGDSKLRNRAQSLRIFECNRPRSFALNTPRLESAGLTIDSDFSNPALDKLYRSRTHAVDPAEIAAELNIEDNSADMFLQMFHERPPEKLRPVENVEIRLINHACVLIRTKDVSLLIDPLISYGPGVQCAHSPKYSEIPQDLDFILITHNHPDHVVLETLLELRHRGATIVLPRHNSTAVFDPSLISVFDEINCKKCISVEPLDVVRTASVRITALPFLGEHGDLAITSKTGYVVEVENKRIAFLADSNNLDHRLYDRLKCIASQPDLLFIGMECDGAPTSWLYGGLLSKPLSRKQDQDRRLNGSDSEKAKRICQILEPKTAVVYAMGMEPWLSHLMATDYTEDSRPLLEAKRLKQSSVNETYQVEFPTEPKTWTI